MIGSASNQQRLTCTQHEDLFRLPRGWSAPAAAGRPARELFRLPLRGFVPASVGPSVLPVSAESRCTSRKARYDHVVAHEAAQPTQPTAVVPADFIERIVEELDPLEIWLFGSRARGTHRPESDWDLMAVLPDNTPEDNLDIVKVWTRLRDIHAKRVELFPVTKSEFDRFKFSLGSLSQIVASDGIVVYAR
ncbi:MAG: nucleotidyltransferase domain-containing protein [Deltaproteobacteria bacterium]|nr:MAG: nucleotidyltransferase domain-containing protein [Deltaproteobacteria bacterium]